MDAVTALQALTPQAQQTCMIAQVEQFTNNVLTVQQAGMSYGAVSRLTTCTPKPGDNVLCVQTPGGTWVAVGVLA